MQRVLDQLASRGGQPWWTGGHRYVARCPGHAGDGFLLKIAPGMGDRVALTCETGCTLAAIVSAGKLDERDVVAARLADVEDAFEVEKSADHGKPLASSGRFRLLSDIELEQLPPITFLVDGVLPTSGLGAIYGPPAAGKSFLALDMACSVATGAPWLGRTTQQGSVVYVAAEGSAGLRQRLGAWKRQQGIEGASLPVYFLTQPANLLTPADLAQLLIAFEALPQAPSLVIIDTLHRSMPGGDENSAKDVGLVIEHADQLRRATRAAVLLIHHTAKGSDLERGSSSLRGGVDALLYAKAEDSRRELRCEKAKDWAPFNPIPFELHVVGDSCVIRAAEDGGSIEVDASTGPWREALTILSRDFATRGATSSEWLKATALKESTYYRIRSQLVRRGYVTEPSEARGGRYRITDSGRSLVTSMLPRSFHGASTPPAPVASTLPHPFRGGSDGSKAQGAHGD